MTPGTNSSWQLPPASGGWYASPTRWPASAATNSPCFFPRSPHARIPPSPPKRSARPDPPACNFASLVKARNGRSASASASGSRFTPATPGTSMASSKPPPTRCMTRSRRAWRFGSTNTLSWYVVRRSWFVVRGSLMRVTYHEPRTSAVRVARRGLLQESQHRSRFVEVFLVFVLEPRVGDDAAAGPETDRAARVDQRADRDVQVHVAVASDIPDRAAIHASTGRLELPDDLHRAQLGRAGDRAARKAAAQQIERVAALPQPAGHRADQVMHRGEALDLEQLRHLDRAQFAVLRQVVAQQIDDHHVLGAVILARAQRLGEISVEPRMTGTRPRALDRLGLDVAALELEKAFRGSRHHGAVRRVQKSRIGRRIDDAQRLIRKPRIAGGRRGKALRKIDLVAVARPDVIVHAA